MSPSRVTQRYVKSLFGLVIEQDAVEAVHKDMKMVAEICRSSRPFTMMLHNPIIRHDKKRKILEAVLKDNVHPLTLAMVDLITRKNREPLLPEIAAHFHTAYNAYKQIGHAVVHTAIPIEAAQLEEINRLVKHLSGKSQWEIDQKVEADLIGGFVLDVGDNRIDMSVKNKLHTLKVKFNS